MPTIAGMMLATVLGFTGDDPAKAPDLSEFLVIPLRIHVLTASDLPEVDCKLTDSDIERIIAKVNRVWRPAGVYWGVESIVREAAAKQDRFRALRALVAENGPVPLNVFKLLMPEPSRSKEGMDVYYIHKFSVNGVFLGDRVAFVQETASLREVEGGIDEPIPRVTAHELGHALGLPHRQARTNLLASGTTGTTLNAAESAIAREGAKGIPGSLSMADLRKRIDEEKTPKRLEILKRWRDDASRTESVEAKR